MCGEYVGCGRIVGFGDQVGVWVDYFSFRQVGIGDGLLYGDIVIGCVWIYEVQDVFVYGFFDIQIDGFCDLIVEVVFFYVFIGGDVGFVCFQ